MLFFSFFETVLLNLKADLWNRIPQKTTVAQPFKRYRNFVKPVN